MPDSMAAEPWVERSSTRAQLGLAVALTVVGAVLVVAARGADGANATAGLLLGILLIAIGAVGALATGEQTVTVDPGTRTITVDDVSRLRARRTVVSFDEIREIRIGFVGKHSSGVTFHHLSLALTGGGRFTLFAPGRFFPGGSSRAAAERRRERLEAMLRTPA